MSKLKTVLVMGRPNVGKSTFVNRILKTKRAITLDQPGVTRDILRYETAWKGVPFVLADSGGVLFSKADDLHLQDKIDEKVAKAIEEADVVLFLVDGKAGVHPSDMHITRRLQPYKKKTILVVNKSDEMQKADESASGFYQLGFGKPIPVSASQGHGFSQLMDQALQGLPKLLNEEDHAPSYDYKVCLTGRPNVGKSSLINALVRDDLVIVSDEAGTTRDSVDVYFMHYAKKYIFTDTAGLRRQSKNEDGIEYYALRRSTKAIETADVVVVVLDAGKGLSQQDKRIITQVLNARRNMILFVNKWDKEIRSEQAQKDLTKIFLDQFPALINYPILFGSAKDRTKIEALLDLIPTVIETGQKRLQTAELNRFVDQVIKRSPPPATKAGKRMRVYYATQAEKSPPVFVFFVSQEESVGQDYSRCIEKKLRAYYGGFLGNPIEVKFKSRTRSERKSGSSDD